MYTLVAPKNIYQIWPKVAPWIAKAISEEESHWEDLNYIKEHCLTGNMQLWVGHAPRTSEIDLVLVTEGNPNFGEKPILILHWVTGKNVDSWLFDIGLLESWAKQQGFHEIQVLGRFGWKKKLAPLGYTYKYTVLGKIIDRGIH